MPPEPTDVARNRLIAAMTVVAGISLGGALWGMTVERDSVLISAYFLATQDAPVLWLFVLFFAVAGAMLAYEPAFPALGALNRQHAFRWTWAAVIVGCGVAWAGASLVCRNFPLAMDEFMAEFDARILAAGKLLASVAPDWRAYVPALQPIFRLELPENAYWASSYLPMNAAIRAVFVLAGAPALEGVALAGVAMIALVGVARRLWPDRPDAALVGVLLLVGSPQFLITAMTPYAMTAHLAFNMVWLWLFLRDTRASHVAAAGVAFVASGLHQVVFHPLFAAPFVGSLLIARRWKLAAYYVVVYGLIGLFWVLYWTFVIRAVHVPMVQSADVGMLNFIDRIAAMINVSLGGLLLMGLNLLRFLAWQSPLVIPLALVGLLSRQGERATMVCLAAGIVLTLAVVQVLMPFQGHGWGYRYLHGFLGSLSLMAAQGWIALAGPGPQRPRASVLALAASLVVSFLVVLPWHAYQVRAFVTPYTAAVEAIEHSGAAAVIVDPTDIWYGQDLVRNDPFLRTPPKMLSLQKLDEPLLAELCRRGDVAMFDRADAQRLGIPIIASLPDIADRNAKLRDLARSLACGRPVLAGR